MVLVRHAPGWRAADVDAAAWWAACGGQWLTGGPPRVPAHLVRSLAGLVRHLDARGAGLASDFAAGGLGVLGEHAALLGLRPSSDVSCGGATQLLRASDGWLCLSLSRSDDVDLLPAWLELDGPVSEPWATVAGAVARRAGADLVARAAELGMACALLGEARDRRDAVLVERFGDAAPVDLAGRLVVNLASLWAGPLCADVLARCGARVVTVESPRRPDGGRAQPAFFAALHGSDDVVAVDLADPALAALLRAADVVIEGSRPRALAHAGVDAAALVAAGGPRVWVSITGHGRAEPYATRVGFGDDAAVAGGLVAGTAAAPAFLADAVADPLAGLTAAATVLDLLASGGRWLVDVALARVAASMLGELLPTDLPAAPPEPRRGATRTAPTLGRDTARVLAELGLGR